MKFDSLLAKMDRLPPCLCRLYARKRCEGGRNEWGPKSHSEIAKESGIPKSTVAEMSRLRTWAGIPVDIADRFARACGLNLAEINEAVNRLRTHRTRFQHLGNGDGHQRRMVAQLLAKVKTK